MNIAANDETFYYLRLTRDDVLRIGEQLSKPGSACLDLGERLLFHFKPAPNGGCAVCGGPGPEFTHPLSPLTEVYMEGLKAVGGRSLVTCRRCINDYYIGHGQPPAFPELVGA